MKTRPIRRTKPRPLVAARLMLQMLCVLGLPSAALADRDDRTKSLTMESDRPCTLDLANQVSICSGNVVITQGTLQIRAERVELRETADGFRSASASGVAGKPAQYRQRRDGGSDEFVEGSADRIEYDGKSDTVRLTGNATMRRIRAGTLADEISGAQIVWNNSAELFSVQGGNATAGNPGGRVRAVLAPRETAASAPLSGASSALRPSGTLGDRR
jgi:lipopolysaccharide export system protein LptA